MLQRYYDAEQELTIICLYPFSHGFGNPITLNENITKSARLDGPSDKIDDQHRERMESK